MQFLKIVVLCILASVVYGILHDQVTARICVEYFTVFHPPVFSTTSPTLLGLGWGIIATWWAGAIIGLLLASTARLGTRNQIGARELVRPVCWLMIAMAICASLAGIYGYHKGAPPGWLLDALPPEKQRPFLADWYAHTASYASGFVGGLVLCSVVAFRRLRARLLPSTP